VFALGTVKRTDDFKFHQMNYDEFAFFNQQLAGMLRDGIPLEGSLKQLCAGMRAGPLRQEMEQLEADLGRGTPLKEALARRQLPDFYVRMVEIGVHSNDLPGTLILLADYYHRSNALWVRLKGLMVYPLIVVVVSLGLTLMLSLAFSRFMANFFDQISPPPALTLVSVWIPPIVLGVATLAALGVLLNPAWRARLRWRLPAFREASLAQLAASIALMLRNGTPLTEALALAQTLEATTPAGKALGTWRQLVESGQGKPSHWPATNPFPPLFLWLVQQSREDPAAGFQKAADIYHERASYRIELALYGALPISVLLLGQMVFWQAAPLLRSMVWMMNMLGDMGG
jgi:type II secretory pathway component PulF